MPVSYWNHNVHYQPLILRAVPPGCGTALDVGCGDGMLVRKLAARCAHVTGIDVDGGMIALAKERANGTGVSFVEADFLSQPITETFDFICANTSLHHMDFEQALNTIAGLLRPGGRAAIIGLAKDVSPRDYLLGAAGMPVDRLYKVVRHEGGIPGLPVREPDMSWDEVKKAARSTLPGVRYRRHLLWRYSLRWDKPVRGAARTVTE
jgi:SAM-dependent methyltransferase